MQMLRIIIIANQWIIPITWLCLNLATIISIPSGSLAFQSIIITFFNIWFHQFIDLFLIAFFIRHKLNHCIFARIMRMLQFRAILQAMIMFFTSFASRNRNRHFIHANHPILIFYTMLYDKHYIFYTSVQKSFPSFLL